MTIITLHPLTASSLRLALYFNGTLLSVATGYPIIKNGQHYLVSNYHVFSGREPGSERVLSSSGAIPNSVGIAHHKKGKLGAFVEIREALIDNGDKNLFKRHPNTQVDLAFLPLTTNADISVNVVKHKEQGSIDIPIWPSEDVSIIGFPFGLSSNAAFPIWKTGHVATEIDLPFQGLPCFLVDAATRGGMSGSPVFGIIRSPYKDKLGNTVMSTSSPVRFLGTYSGRLNIPQNFRESLPPEQSEFVTSLGSDLGMVGNWKLIDEIV